MTDDDWKAAARVLGVSVDELRAALPAVQPVVKVKPMVTGMMLHDIFVKRMAHAYVDEDPIELKGVCMDGYFNLIQIADDINAAIAALDMS